MKDKAGSLARHAKKKRIAIRHNDGKWHEVSHITTEMHRDGHDSVGMVITTVWFKDSADDVKTFNPDEDVEFLIL